MERSKRRLSVAVIGLVALVATGTHAGPLETREAAVAGAQRLASLQFADGSFPWFVGDPRTFQNVQGITGIGLLKGYKVSLDEQLLEAAKKLRDWHEGYRNGTINDCCSASLPAPRRFSAGSYFFLAEYALLSGNLSDLAFAREALQHAVDFRGGPTAFATFILNARKASSWTNLGLWDVALYARAAQDVGFEAMAEEFATVLATQTIVDPFDSTAGAYELGLAGLLFGLAEADAIAHAELLGEARDALVAAQAEDGSFPLTYRGTVYPGDIQGTAYAVVGLQAVGAVEAALAGGGFLAAAQRADGSFPLSVPDGGGEIGEVDSEAVMALVAATVLAPQGVLNYADPVRAHLG